MCRPGGIVSGAVVFLFQTKQAKFTQTGENRENPGKKVSAEKTPVKAEEKIYSVCVKNCQTIT